jgi:AraC-like DNA-binding protein/mannose-6-phosphate isomerase-like protein (cupin superfamily)
VSSIFEKIGHNRAYPAKIFVTRLESSRLHWHYDYELVVVLEGDLQIFTSPTIYHLRAGDIILLNSKVIHGMKGTEDGNLCLFIQFSPSFFEGVIRHEQVFYFYLNSAGETLPPKLPYRHFVTASVRIGLCGRQSSLAAELRTHALLQTMAADLVEYTEYDTRSIRISCEDHLGETISEISMFIDNNLQDEKLHEHILRTFGRTEKTLYRILKDATGLSLKELIDIARVEKSKQLLQETDKSIIVISDECGFSNEATFYRVFKKETKRTPHQFRLKGSAPLVEPQIQGYIRTNEKQIEQALRQYLTTNEGQTVPKAL